MLRPGTAALIAAALALALLSVAPVAVESVPASQTVNPDPAMSIHPRHDPARHRPVDGGPHADGHRRADARVRRRSATPPCSTARAAPGPADGRHRGRRRPKPKAESKAPVGKIRARGDATWYCVAGVSPCHRDYGGGLYAAAGSELRVGDWRGRTVTVCAGGACIRVTLVDWCACEGDRVIDLYGDAFRRLAPLDQGVIEVSVRW